MNEKLYVENYPCYKSRQFLKQTSNEALCYSSPNFSTNGAVNTNFMDVCNLSSQNLNCQPNNHNSIFLQQEQVDILTWEDKVISDVEKTIKKSDKTDVSSASYCSNVDLINYDSYKQNINKNVHDFNKFENDWSCIQNNCSQKTPTYASCALEKFPINIPKNQGIDYLMRNCNYKTFHGDCNIHCKSHDKNVPSETVPNYVYNYYDNKFTESLPLTENVHYLSAHTNTTFAPVINSISQEMEDSNEESDIIVEESDEEIIDYRNIEKQALYLTNKCLICNVIYEPLGTQFYFLTDKSPLTMSTQKPVVQKLLNIVGDISTDGNYLCSECLGHINNIDHLELNLEKFKSDLVISYRKTCLENNIQNIEKSSTRKVSRFKKWPRYKCKFCSKILCLKNYCLYHVKRHKNRSYLCDFCGNVYSNRRKFLLHHKQHKSKFCKIVAFKCSNCKKTFRTNSNKKEHENYCLNILPFKCKHQNCSKKFPSATKLKNHVKLKHDKKFLVICSICNTGFVKMSDYKSHMTSHSADKKYSCPKCHRNYKTLSNLNFHMKIHSDTLPFICHICKKGFMRKEYLEAHVNNHKGLKNFSCSQCGKKFVSQKNLDAHVKYHEGTAKKNTCNICGKTMTSGFEEHLRVHNNLREFECEHCDMKFNTKGTLSKHIKKKHNIS